MVILVGFVANIGCDHNKEGIGGQTYYLYPLSAHAGLLIRVNLNLTLIASFVAYQLYIGGKERVKKLLLSEQLS